MRPRPAWVTVASAAALGACGSRSDGAAAERPGPVISAASAASAAPAGHTPEARSEILSCVDLRRDDPLSNDLSGLVWDGEQRLLYALSDRRPQITILAPRPGFAGYELRGPIELAIDLSPGKWDGEALAIARDRFLVVAQETMDAVFSVDRSGHRATRIELPPFPGTRDNKGLESLGYVESAEGRYLFAVNEQALESDGPVSTVEHGTVVRILRHRMRGEEGGGDGGNDGNNDKDSDDLVVAYRTEPVFARASRAGGSDNGVSDIAVLSPERLLVLERAYVPGAGNAIRIYEVDVRGARDVRGVADARAAAPVPKRLVLDLALLPDTRCPGPARPGQSRALENYEGMALGPLLPDGRRVLFLVSDDNCCESRQIPRLLAIALARGALD